jgi:hypothetical protein
MVRPVLYPVFLRLQVFLEKSHKAIKMLYFRQTLAILYGAAWDIWMSFPDTKTRRQQILSPDEGVEQKT